MNKHSFSWRFVPTLVLINVCLSYAPRLFGVLRPYEEMFSGFTRLLSLAALLVCIADAIYSAVRISTETPLPDRYQLNQLEYPDLLAAYSESLLEDEYTFEGEISNPLGCDMLLYLRRGFLGMECFLFLHADEYSQEMEDAYGSFFWDYLCRRHPDAPGQEISLLSLVCIQHLTPAFEARVNANIQQVQYHYHLPAGVCFSNRTVYVPPQNGGRYKSRYKEMRKTLLRYI